MATTAQKIKALLQEGKKPAEIAKKLNISRQYIYNVKRRQKVKSFEPAGLVEIAVKQSLWQRFISFFRR
jgi:transposase